jgi:putative ABC transport system permease protein
MHDFRNALRALRATPMITVMAVLSLALGIGANTAIFSLINGLLLRSLPVKEPQRLVLLDKGSWTNPIWEQIRDRKEQVFEGAAACSTARFDLARGGQAEFVEGLWVSGGFFEVLGVQAILGRTLTVADDVRGGPPEGPAAIISYSFWQRHFGSAPDAVGQTLALNRVPFTIVGVTPPEFFGPTVGRTFDVAIPVGAEPLMRGKESWLERRSTWWLEIFARLKPGQSLQDAQSQLRAIQPQIREATLPTDWRPVDLDRYLRDGFELKSAVAGSSYLRDRYARPLLTLLVVSALVLLIACANIANLFLARAASRRHEMSVRIALGASRLRLTRQLLAESLVLATMGVAFGMLLAQWASRLLVRQLSTQRNVVFLDLSFDWRMLVFTGAVAVAAVLLFGMAPAFRASQANPIAALTSRDRGIEGHRKGVLSHPLVVVQVALSVVLVVAAGLFLRTFTELANLKLGFDRDPVMIVRIDAQRSSVESSRRADLFQRIRDAAASAPGVALAAISVVTPVSGSTWNNLLEFPDGSPLTERERIVNMNLISPEWFATYGSRILAGRDFDARDRAGAPPVAIVNQAFAVKYFGGANPIGRTIQQSRPPGIPRPSQEIVGLVENSVYRALREPLSPTFYLPIAQRQPDGLSPDINISFRPFGGRPELVAKGVTEAVSAVDKDLSMTFLPLAAQINSSLVQERLIAMLSGFFGALALLLAGIGLYGITAYSVGTRRREIGIRMALGAKPAGIVRMVVVRVAALVGLGAVLGTIASLWAARFVDKLLFGLRPNDPITLVAASLVLAAIGVIAGWLPARRAARIQPADVLREG